MTWPGVVASRGTGQGLPGRELWSDCGCEFGDDGRDAEIGWDVECEFVVAAAEVLDESVTGGDSRRRAEAFRPRIGRSRAFNRP